MALLTTTDRNIEASPEGLAHDFLLVLRFDPLDFQGTATLTVRGRGYRNHFVDSGGNGSAVPLAIGGTGLAPRRLRILFPRTPRKGCGLALIGPLCFLQLSLQFLVFLPQLFSFLLQLLLASPQLVVFLVQLFDLPSSATPPLLKRSQLLLPLPQGCDRIKGHGVYLRTFAT
jgi:hypothetical protein